MTKPLSLSSSFALFNDDVNAFEVILLNVSALSSMRLSLFAKNLLCINSCMPRLNICKVLN